MTDAFDQLGERQRGVVGEWLPGAEVVRDHSWGLVGTTVLEVVSGGQHFVVKAGDEADQHLAREVRAHREWAGVWVAGGRSPELVFADVPAKVLVTRFLPGVLVQGAEAESDPGIYRQAGELLRVFHGQAQVLDQGFEARARAKALWWLDRPHRIPAEAVARLREIVAGWPAASTVLVPTHGDWQPRNWLVHKGVLAVIDFGRADLRSAESDFARLVAQQFRRDPALEVAFFEGYGERPGDPESWRRVEVREAIGTAAWAHQVGDAEFERQGLRMIEDVLAVG